MGGRFRQGERVSEGVKFWRAFSLGNRPYRFGAHVGALNRRGRVQSVREGERAEAFDFGSSRHGYFAVNSRETENVEMFVSVSYVPWGSVFLPPYVPSLLHCQGLLG